MLLSVSQSPAFFLGPRTQAEHVTAMQGPGHGSLEILGVSSQSRLWASEKGARRTSQEDAGSTAPRVLDSWERCVTGDHHPQRLTASPTCQAMAPWPQCPPRTFSL